MHRRPHGSSNSSSSGSSRLPLSTGSTCSAMPAQGIRRRCSPHTSRHNSSTPSTAHRHHRSMASSSSNSSAQTGPRPLQRPAAAVHSGGRHYQMATCYHQSHREQLQLPRPESAWRLVVCSWGATHLVDVHHPNRLNAGIAMILPRLGATQAARPGSQAAQAAGPSGHIRYRSQAASQPLLG